jgi:hypothetical protein
MNMTIDLDDLFNDIYYMDLPGGPQPAPSLEERHGLKRTADEAAGGSGSGPTTSSNNDALNDVSEGGLPEDEGVLTEAQKIERRERNREHAKRSRLRKKFLLESLQEQIHGLEEQLDGLKAALKTELPSARADEIITKVCGDKEKYTPLPMPSGFGPVKTLMEPDFRLSKYLFCSYNNQPAQQLFFRLWIYISFC